MDFDTQQTDLSRIQSLTVRVEAHDHLTNLLASRRRWGNAAGENGGKDTSWQLHDPFLFMLPLIPQALTSLSLGIEGSATDQVVTSLSNVLSQAWLSPLQHLKVSLQKGAAGDWHGVAWH